MKTRKPSDPNVPDELVGTDGAVSKLHGRDDTSVVEGI
jgi:hypothetical protein